MKTLIQLLGRAAVLPAVFALCSVASAATTNAWNGADAATSTNWTDVLNLTGNLAPGATDTAFFNNNGMSAGAGSSSIDNVVNANLTVAGLAWAETNGFHNTLIS